MGELRDPDAPAMPRVFSADFERRVTFDDGAFLSTAPRAVRADRRGGVRALTGRYAFEAATRRHAFEYVDAEGRLSWLSTAARPMAEPDPALVMRVPVTFTDGTRR